MAIKADYFVTFTIAFRLGDHITGPIPQLIKGGEAGGPARSRKAGGMEMDPCKGEKRLGLFRLHISFP